AHLAYEWFPDATARAESGYQRETSMMQLDHFPLHPDRLRAVARWKQVTTCPVIASTMKRLPIEERSMANTLAEIFDSEYFAQMPTRNRSNPLALAVLACLHEAPMHPYQVAQTLRSRAKHESIRLNYGSLYSVVESLERRGLIQGGEAVREGRRPERTVYAITDAGSRELTDWLSALLAVPQKEYLQFEAALSLLPHIPPTEAVELLAERVATLESQLVAGIAIRESVESPQVPRLFLIEHEYAETLWRAEIQFVKALIADIENARLDGLPFWHNFHAADQPVQPVQFDSSTDKEHG
ncbi:MAG: transcriptional regulator, PadR-like family, partial [Acidimicrobiia bacterium]|nr:transcriptional regulator, PadR-like family [Acidimicrobiia bacterium]